MPVDEIYKALPFEEAILFLRRKLSLPTATWRDLLRAAHDWAFVVAGATKAQLLSDLREAVDRAIADGTTLEDFRKDFDRAVREAGWSYRGSRGWRTRLIYQTNVQTAYAAGRRAQMRSAEVMRDRPYWQYRHGGSAEPRPKHVARAPEGWNRLVLPADHEFWQAHYPPNGWGCSCFVVTLSAQDLRRLGLPVGDWSQDADGTYEWTNPDTGEVEDIPRGIDPGWNYAPGASPVEERRRLFDDVLRRIPAELRDQARQEVSQFLGGE